MARYREKSPEDMAWNRIRRHLTRELDTAIGDAREEALNSLLTHAFDEFVKAVEGGTMREVESKYAALSLAIVKDIVPDAAKVLDGAPVE